MRPVRDHSGVDNQAEDSSAAGAEIDDDMAAAESDKGGDEPTETADQASEVGSDRYLRLVAEFDNYRKRTAREFGDVIRSANIRLLRELIEITDNFERAMSHESDVNGGEAYRKGVELIYNQLAELLKKEGVTAIESKGQPFDPNYHEALMQAESDEYDEGMVSQEILKGYKLDDKVLRHARVVVSRGRSESNEENE